MNYPLGTAILGFVGGDHLNMDVIQRHDSYRRMIQPLDGPAFARRLEALMTNYDPAVVAVQLNLIGSHDTPRALTVLGDDRTALGLATVLQATLPGAPCIYYGDEIAMAGDHDPDNRRAYPADPAAGDRELRAFVQALAAARHEHVALRRGSVRVLSAAGGPWPTCARPRAAGRSWRSIPGPPAVSLAVPRPDDRPYRPLELPGLATGSWAEGTIALPPESALVLVEA